MTLWCNDLTFWPDPPSLTRLVPSRPTRAPHLILLDLFQASLQLVLPSRTSSNPMFKASEMYFDPLVDSHWHNLLSVWCRPSGGFCRAAFPPFPRSSIQNGSPVLNPSVRKFWKICFKVVIFQNQDAQVKSEDAVLIWGQRGGRWPHVGALTGACQ